MNGPTVGQPFEALPGTHVIPDGGCAHSTGIEEAKA